MEARNDGKERKGLIESLGIKAIGFAVFLMCWIISSYGLSCFFRPKPITFSPRNDFGLFAICTLNDGKSNHMFLKDYDGKRPLCKKEDEWELISFRLKFYEVNNQVSNSTSSKWKLESWSGSLSDPITSHYQIKTFNGHEKVVPISLTSGGLMNTITSWFFGLFIALGLSKLINRYL